MSRKIQMAPEEYRIPPPVESTSIKPGPITTGFKASVGEGAAKTPAPKGMFAVAAPVRRPVVAAAAAAPKPAATLKPFVAPAPAAAPAAAVELEEVPAAQDAPPTPSLGGLQGDLREMADLIEQEESKNLYSTEVPEAYIPQTRRGFAEFIKTTYKPFELPAGAIPSGGKYYPYQMFVRDYMRQESPYRGVLVYHGLGSGKTCTSIATAEALFATTHKKIIVMASYSLKKNFFSEISKCGFRHFQLLNYWVPLDPADPTTTLFANQVLGLSGAYLKRATNVWVPDFRKTPEESNYKSLSDEQRQEIRKQILSILEWHPERNPTGRIRFIAYNGISAKKLIRMACDPAEEKFFDNAVIVVDEIHNLIRNIQGKIEPYLTTRTIKGGKRRVIPVETAKPTPRWRPTICDEDTKLYNRGYLFYRLLTEARNCKIVGLSGTPLINFPEELGILANVLHGYITIGQGIIAQVGDRMHAAAAAVAHKHPFIDFVRVKANELGGKGGVPAGGTHVLFSLLPPGVRKIANDIGVERIPVGEEVPTLEEIVESVKAAFSEAGMPFRQLDMSSEALLPPFGQDFRDMFVQMTAPDIIKNRIVLVTRLTGLVSYYKGSQLELMPKVIKDEVVRVPFSLYSQKAYSARREMEVEREMEAKKKSDGPGGAVEKIWAQIYQLGDTAAANNYKMGSRQACNFSFPPEVTRPAPAGKKERAEEAAAGVVSGEEITLLSGEREGAEEAGAAAEELAFEEGVDDVEEKAEAAAAAAEEAAILAETGMVAAGDEEEGGMTGGGMTGGGEENEDWEEGDWEEGDWEEGEGYGEEEEEYGEEKEEYGEEEEEDGEEEEEYGEEEEEDDTFADDDEKDAFLDALDSNNTMLGGGKKKADAVGNIAEALVKTAVRATVGLPEKAEKKESEEAKVAEKVKERDEAAGAAGSGPIRFYHQLENQYKVFSTYSEFPFSIDGVTYPTIEHYYQSQLFEGTDPEHQKAILAAKTGMKAKLLGKLKDHPMREDYKKVRDEIMKRAQREKFKQNEVLRTLLLSTGDRPLIDASPKDSYWGEGAEKDGKNKLGAILEELRAEFKEEDAALARFKEAEEGLGLGKKVKTVKIKPKAKPAEAPAPAAKAAPPAPTFEDCKAGRKPGEKYVDACARAKKCLATVAKEHLTLGGPDGLERYSPKYAAMLKRIAEAPGSSLVYSQFLDMEGIGIFRVAMDVNGYAPIEIIQVGGTFAFSEATEASLRKGPGKQPRYITFSGGEDPKVRSLGLDLFNAKFSELSEQMMKVLTESGYTDNKVGEICRVFCITSAGAEGLSLRNVRAVHIMEPYWNEVRLRQVKGRAIRIGSHLDLPEDQRNVAIYTYVSVFPDEAQASKAGEYRINETLLIHDSMDAKDAVDSGIPVKTGMRNYVLTTDEMIYAISEKKRKIVESLESVLKSAAVDCELNYRQNKEGDSFRCLTLKGKVGDFLYSPLLSEDLATASEREIKAPVAAAVPVAAVPVAAVPVAAAAPAAPPPPPGQAPLEADEFHKLFKKVLYIMKPVRSPEGTITGFRMLDPKTRKLVGAAGAKDGKPAPPVDFFEGVD